MLRRSRCRSVDNSRIGLYNHLTENNVRDNGAVERFLDEQEKRILAAAARILRLIAAADPDTCREDGAELLREPMQDIEQCLELTGCLSHAVFERINCREETADVTEPAERFLEELKRAQHPAETP